MYLIKNLNEFILIHCRCLKMKGILTLSDFKLFKKEMTAWLKMAPLIEQVKPIHQFAAQYQLSHFTCLPLGAPCQGLEASDKSVQRVGDENTGIQEHIIF